jgi:hypothetical protein
MDLMFTSFSRFSPAGCAVDEWTMMIEGREIHKGFSTGSGTGFSSKSLP